MEKGCATNLLSIVASVQLTFLYFIFVALGLSTRDSAFVFFILEFWSFFYQHPLFAFETITSFI
jgi:hypothetical protein